MIEIKEFIRKNDAKNPGAKKLKKIMEEVLRKEENIGNAFSFDEIVAFCLHKSEDSKNVPVDFTGIDGEKYCRYDLTLAWNMLRSEHEDEEAFIVPEEINFGGKKLKIFNKNIRDGDKKEIFDNSYFGLYYQD